MKMASLASRRDGGMREPSRRVEIERPQDYDVKTVRAGQGPGRKKNPPWGLAIGGPENGHSSAEQPPHVLSVGKSETVIMRRATF